MASIYYDFSQIFIPYHCKITSVSKFSQARVKQAPTKNSRKNAQKWLIGGLTFMLVALMLESAKVLASSSIRR